MRPLQYRKVKDMEKIIYFWEIHENKTGGIDRYCPSCRDKVKFVDTGLRRHNANGKNIHEYVIYKCLNGHTWNKPLATFKSTHPIIKQVENIPKVSTLNSINTGAVILEGKRVIEIHICDISTKIRLDKILSLQIEDLSRSQIAKLIAYGRILVDENKVEPNTILRKGNIIKINLAE